MIKSDSKKILEIDFYPVSASLPLAGTKLTVSASLPLAGPKLTPDGRVRVGVREVLECQTWGSRPPANVSWWRDGRLMASDHVTEVGLPPPRRRGRC